MTGKDQGDEDQGFLARWSQRKRETKAPERQAPVADADVPSSPVAESEAAQQFDLSSLPKLEDVTEATDITGFLREGVPEHLRNAALRKSWALDPAIRNYVNPALEYAYDWNTPGGVPGSSEIGTGMDVARLVSQITGSSEPADEAPAKDVETGNGPAQSPGHNAAQEPKPDLPTQALRLGNETISTAQEPSNIAAAGKEAVQAEASKEGNSAAPQQAVRRHGSAKPSV
jgi:Protein of unknown function (DUF3306)